MYRVMIALMLAATLSATSALALQPLRKLGDDDLPEILRMIKHAKQTCKGGVSEAYYYGLDWIRQSDYCALCRDGNRYRITLSRDGHLRVYPSKDINCDDRRPSP
jgi:hypothetical protein